MTPFLRQPKIMLQSIGSILQGLEPKNNRLPQAGHNEISLTKRLYCHVVF